MKIILDTNILVGIFLRGNSRSYSYRLLAKCLSGELRPQISNALFCEYTDVLFRESVMASSVYNVKERQLILDELFYRSDWSNVYYLWRPNLPDEGEDYSETGHLIELAIASQTPYIITMNQRDFVGDLDTGINIVKPKEFMTEVLKWQH